MSAGLFLLEHAWLLRFRCPRCRATSARMTPTSLEQGQQDRGGSPHRSYTAGIPSDGLCRGVTACRPRGQGNQGQGCISAAVLALDVFGVLGRSVQCSQGELARPAVGGKS